MKIQPTLYFHSATNTRRHFGSDDNIPKNPKMDRLLDKLDSANTVDKTIKVTEEIVGDHLELPLTDEGMKKGIDIINQYEEKHRNTNHRITDR